MRSSIRISVARQHCQLLVQQQVHLQRFKLFVHQRDGKAVFARFVFAQQIRQLFAGVEGA